MKRCSFCKLEKPFTDFPPRTKRGYGYHARCRQCKVTALKAWREANPEMVRTRDTRRRWKRRLLVTEYLLTHPCVDCGMTNPVVLDFDHIKERGPKLFNIGECSRNLRVEVIIAEIAKCEIRCSNCHRIKTAERNLAHWSHRLLAGSQGVEPRPSEPKPLVLPLHHEPIRRGRTPGLQLLLI